MIYVRLGSILRMPFVVSRCQGGRLSTDGRDLLGSSTNCPGPSLRSSQARGAFYSESTPPLVGIDQIVK